MDNKKINPERHSIADEFMNLPINDQRIINRIIATAIMLDAQPGKSLPEAAGSWAEAKGTYRLMDNSKVVPEVILEGHYRNTIKRMSLYNIVLILQDTTNFDFSTHKNTKGLGPYSTSPSALGLLMHSAFVVTTSGVPLGILYQSIWARDPLEKGKRYRRRKLPMEAKESYKWIAAMEASLKDIPTGTTAVTVADREADIFELFKKATSEGHHLLIRAVQNRSITEEHKLLRAQIENSPIAGICRVEIPRDQEHKLQPREVKLQVQFCPVTVISAYAKKTDKTALKIKLYAVLAKELDPLEGIEPIEWLLLTTLPVTTLEEAVEKIGWYRRRWIIERFHFTLKSGCKIEELQLETSERLKNAIAIYSVVAWRLLWIIHQSRETPEAPCSIILETHEWQILYCIVNKTKVPPKEPPTLKEAVMLIAKYGGFLGRKHDGQPE